jgi:mono/diheme cytochrome c family protein
MSRLLPQRAVVAAGVTVWLHVAVMAQQPTGPRDAGGYPAPSPELERGRAVYVLNHCHFCHGVDLTRSVMGATDLMRSGLVAADTDGSLISPVVRAGKPNLQTSMPSYAELTDIEIREMSRYIHFLRQSGRYRELTTEPLGEGEATAGGELFARQCLRCHARSGDLQGIATRFSDQVLRDRMLRPMAASAPPAVTSGNDGHRQHGILLERLTEADVRNLVAYLQSPLEPR